MKIIGIESSCDDTSISVVDSERSILSNEVVTKNDTHNIYKGIVPELAARNHVIYIDKTLRNALQKARIKINEVDLIAATAGPGLIGGLLVGLTFAKTLAQVNNIPFVAVNHLEGHALTTRLTSNINYPFLLLLISGGHSSFYFVKEVNHYDCLGGTLDDALGEAFDKVANVIGLSFPGGPKLEALANKGREDAFKFPRPLIKNKGLDLSFSGLKTAVLATYIKSEDKSEQLRADIAASFQKAIMDILSVKLETAIHTCEKKYGNFSNVVISGGVASNSNIRKKLDDVVLKAKKRCYFPPIKLCTDNGAMIAWAGYERYKKGLIDNLKFKARPRWLLENLENINE